MVLNPKLPVIGYPPSSSGTFHDKLISSVTESSSGVDILLDNSITGLPGDEATPYKKHLYANNLNSSLSTNYKDLGTPCM